MARILIVDDHRSIRRALEKFLGGEGYEVATAQDALGAVGRPIRQICCFWTWAFPAAAASTS